MANETKSGTRKIFITGLLIVLPLAVTVAVLLFLFNILDNWLAPLVNELLHLSGVPLPTGWTRIPGLGILATILLVFITGLISRNYIGQRLIRFGHAVMHQIPLVKNVYGGVSQLVKAFSESGATPFQTVVMLEFPRPGIWTLGFVSGDASAVANKVAGAELVNVFIPAAPIPTQGLYLMIPRQDLRILPLSTEEGFKMLATLGLIQQQPGGEAGGEFDFGGSTPAPPKRVGPDEKRGA
jgi:uncharacterized membrane protein